MKADIVIENCSILPVVDASHIKNGIIAVSGSDIVFVGTQDSAPRFETENRIQARGKVAIPGLINCHTHVSMSLFRGVAEDRPLDPWLRQGVWPLERRLRRHDIYVGSLLGCLEMIRGGTTCFADMYFRENMVVKAVEASGLRAVLAEGIISLAKGLLDTVLVKRSANFAKRFNGSAHGRITTMLGPHSAYTCSKRLLSIVRNEAERVGVGIHLHLAESKSMVEKVCHDGRSETDRLEKAGLLNSQVLAAHCIDLSANDMEVLSRHGVKIVHVPVSNMKLGLAAAKVKDFMNKGICVCLGTDGPASNNTLDMFETMKIGALLQKHSNRDAQFLPAYEILQMATINGAKALNLEKSIGTLEVGKKADIVLVDFSKPHLKPMHDPFAGIVYSARSSDVDTVIVDGKMLMERRKVVGLDERAIIEQAEKCAREILSRRIPLPI